MTESEWLTCTRPDDLYLDRFESTPKPLRKLQLFACGCCRQIWEYIADRRCRSAVEVAELAADRLATEDQFGAAFDAVEEACDEIESEKPESIEYGAAFAAQMALRAPSEASYPVAWVLAHTQQDGDYGERLNRNLAALADLFRDVFGNPYRPPNLQDSWLTGKVKSLAQMIYEQRAFSYLGELANALEEAGCHDEEILDHCRSKKVHIKGCWAVDLLLAKGS